MKKFVLALTVLMASCTASVPAMAANYGPDYTSIKCIKFVEGDFDVVKPRLIADLLKGADKNQAMLVEDLSENDLVVAGTNLYCENRPVKEVLEWVGL